MTVRPVSPIYFLGQVLQSMIYNPGLSLSLLPGTTSFLLIIVFAYSESKLTCHFVVVVVVLVLGGKRSEKLGKRSKKVASS